VIDRFARLRSGPRQLTDGERLTAFVAIALVLVASELWTGDPGAWSVGFATGILLVLADRWLVRRGG
jgi:hypothetical protein